MAEASMRNGGGFIMAQTADSGISSPVNGWLVGGDGSVAKL